MSFFKNIFKKSTPERKLNNVKELILGDIIVLSDSFGLPAALRAQEFQITAVNSYEFENKTQAEWVLQGNDSTELYLTLDVDDKIYLKFSLKILHQDIGTLFDLENFAKVFDEPGQAQLARITDSIKTSGWSSEIYQQSSYAQVGYFHRKDYRKDELSPYQGKGSGEQFELYSLFDENQDKGVDIEVWQDGDTEVFLTLFKPTSDIVDMYPGS